MSVELFDVAEGLTSDLLLRHTGVQRFELRPRVEQRDDIVRARRGCTRPQKLEDGMKEAVVLDRIERPPFGREVDSAGRHDFEQAKAVGPPIDVKRHMLALL